MGSGTYGPSLVLGQSPWPFLTLPHPPPCCTSISMQHNLEDLASRTLARDAAQPAIEFEKRWISWGDMRRVADRVATLIEASGAGPSSPVAFVPHSRPSAVAALLGLIAHGRTVQMIYAFQSSAGIARDIGRVDPALVVAHAEDFTPEVLAALRASGAAAIELTEMAAAPVPGFEAVTRPPETGVASQPEIQILTSGTTGPPKRFALGYNTIATYSAGANTLSASFQDDQSHLPPALLYFPLGNISGIYGILPTLLRGQRVVLLERFTVAAWHDHLLRYRPERGGLPPAGVQMVLDANLPRQDLACLRYIGTGAAPVDPTAHRAFEDRYGVKLLLSYGATEFGGPVAAMTAELHAAWGEQKFGSVGRAFAGARLRIVDPQAGTTLPPGKEGLLEVISPKMGPDWIRTSDIAVIDEDAFLFHRGRADGAIMRGGFKMLPETIEHALLLHPAISAAGVVGLPDKRLGQVPAAAIQLKQGAEPPTEAALESHLRGHVYATHIPVAWRFVPELPRTVSLKIDRLALRQLFET